MKFIRIICLLAVMATASSAGADFYRYTDRHGNVIFTDDIKEVPVSQRANAQVADGSGIVSLNAGTSVTLSDPGQTSEDARDDLDVEKGKLEALKSSLQQEYNSLAQENARLKAEQKTAVTPAQRKAYNKEVVGFNTRFQAYKEKEAAYKSRFEKYRKRINSAKSDHDNK